jgi:uncharacterized protein (DUF427 family)
MKAIWKGVVIAESDDTVVVENNHYFPMSSLDRNYIDPSDHTSVCSWKGTANYYSINVANDINQNAVWYYANPRDAAGNIQGRVAFWKGVEVTE